MTTVQVAGAHRQIAEARAGAAQVAAEANQLIAAFADTAGELTTQARQIVELRKRLVGYRLAESFWASQGLAEATIGADVAIDRAVAVRLVHLMAELSKLATAVAPRSEGG